MLVIFFTYWAGMFLQGAESNVSVDIDILQWVVVVTNGNRDWKKERGWGKCHRFP